MDPALQVLFLIILLSFFLLRKINSTALSNLLRKDSSRQPRTNLPPGPRGLPIIGNLHQLSPLSLHVSLHRLASVYGPLMWWYSLRRGGVGAAPGCGCTGASALSLLEGEGIRDGRVRIIMTLRLGSVRTVVISSADAARDAFKNAASNDIFLSGRPQLYATSVLSYGRDIVFMPCGDTWRRMRMACIVNLLNPRRVQSFRAVREEEVAAVLNHVINACSRNAVLDFSELALRHVNDVVCRLVFGRKFNDGSSCGRPLKYILTETQTVFSAFCVSDYFPGMGWVDVFIGLKRRVWKNFRELDRFFDEVICSHLQVTNNGAQEGMECKTASKDDNFVTQLLRLHNDSAFGEAFGCMGSIKGVLMVRIDERTG